jgi:ssDNA-binding Zn-finger/Zn-ribbon topoisomerase 1
MAQTVVNSFIRLRDEKKGCITCGTDLRGRKFDAGHFFSTGAYPNIRFNLDNIHGQCVPCNQHKHGNHTEYFIRLPKRIGLDRFNKLLEIRHQQTKYSIEELKELIKEYKLKIKNYDNNK